MLEDDDPPVRSDAIDDAVWLIFTCCHPVPRWRPAWLTLCISAV